MFDDKDYLELPDVDEDKKRREKIYNKVEKILDKSGIKYDVSKEKVRKFIDNQISLNGNYELFISVEGDENLPKICSAINKEIAEFNGHVSRDNYNFLVLTCESAINEFNIFNKKKSKEEKQKLINARNTKIINIIKPIINKLNNDNKIKKLMKQDLIQYMKQFPDDEDAIYYNKNGLPKLSCYIFDYSSDILIVGVLDDGRDIFYIMDEICKIVKNDKSIVNLKDELGITNINYGDGDEGCLYFEFNKKMYESTINETSFKSKFKYGYKSKWYIPLNKYKEVKIYESNYNHYKSQSKVLSHLNPLSDIRIWIDIEHGNNIVAIAAVDNTLRPGCNWITALEVNEKYRGHKLGKQILDYAVVNMGGNALGVKYDNEVAKHMYEKYGFKISQKSIEKVKNKETSAYHMYYESSTDELELPDKTDHITDINERYIFSGKDISYNMDKFDSGEINVCFITGFSGSGKTTFAKELQNQYSNATFISLDVVFNNKNRFTMDKLKYMNILYYKFFNSIGKKYYLIFDERPDTNTYGNNLIRDFIYFILDYASKNKNIRFIVEGMQIYYYMKPEELSNYAIYVVRTSVTKSIYRAAKRDGSLKNKLSDLSIWTSDKNLYDDFVKYYNESSIDELGLPDKADYVTDINELLNNTNHSRVFLTSDWHLFANHYNHNAKGINKQKIISWCKTNIKDDDVFIYLGDISYRYANDTDIENAKKIMKSIPGIKVLVLGNHDKMLGDEFYAECGFILVYDSFEWNENIFSHKPINMAVYPSRYWNIHGHIHDRVDYYTMEGDHNINVYPSFYDNKPVTLEYILNHKEDLVKDHYWNKEMSGFFTEAANDNIPTVYYCDKINSDIITYMASLFSDRLKGRIAIKLHVGEEGNQNALKPNLLRGLVKYTHGTFVDSNVAYESKRATTEGYKETAEKHGFTKLAYFDVLDADGDMVIQVPYQNQINKGLKELKVKGTEIPVMTPGPHLKEVNVGAHLSSYDSMIVYTHFKGHTMAGYGGAVKNIGMGVPSGKVGKIQVHGKDFRRNPEFLERLVEAAAAVEDYFKGHIIYINVLKNISVDCDCDAVAHDPTISDIGVLVSDNLYAIEQASLDLIRNAPHNKDIIERIASRGGVHQLEYMKFLGMAPDGYILNDLNNRRIKLESTIIDETKRSELPDSAFGIPEDRKYPLDTEQHVKSAIKLFGHAEEGKKKALAQRIRTAAKKYDLSIPETTQCYKYLNEGGLESMIPTEVKNIILDLHGVVIGDIIESTIEHGLIVPHRIAHEIADIIKGIFNNTDFKHYTVEKARDYFISVASEYMRKYADKIFYELLPNMVNEQPYAYELIDTLKSRGYKVYYLSNYAKYVYDMQEAFFVPLLNRFDGGLFDHQSQYSKPQKEFFMEFLNKYNLNASECLFMDDLAENTSTAEAVGMYTLIFDKNETPRILLADKYEIPPDANSMLLVDAGSTLESININDIDSWIIESFNEVYEDYKSGVPWCYSNFKSAIEDEYAFRMAYNDIKTPIESYAFIRGENNNPVLVGKILINPDKSYEWQIQYPLKINENGVYSSSISSINEWAMASCNPIVGISKPFILKISNDSGLINTKQYALSPDIIADKYLVVNEDANLEVVDASKFKDCYIEAYEYTANRMATMNRLNKLNSLYKEKKTVDNTVFYTILAGKPMLSEDQIDFDNKFKKVDFELLKETALTKLATLVSEFNNITKYPYNGISFPVNESISKIINNNGNKLHDIKRIKNYRDISIKEDADGYYVYSNITRQRSKSVYEVAKITDQMIESVLKK